MFVFETFEAGCQPRHQRTRAPGRLCCLLLVAQQAVELVERGANRPHRLQHGVDPIVDCSLPRPRHRVAGIAYTALFVYPIARAVYGLF